MTNSSSTYLGVLIGALIGVITSWWIYYRQKKTTEKQDGVIKKCRFGRITPDITQKNRKIRQTK
jgi:hypothetical protein